MSDHKELCARLAERILQQHGGTDDWRFGWSLTIADSEMHRDALALIEKQAARIAELESKLATESDSHAETLGMYRRRVEQHEQALARIADLEAATRWRPMSECPDSDVEILVVRSDRKHPQIEWAHMARWSPFALGWLPIPPFEEPRP